jgi:RNA polymerase sigma factor (TIGR02999 family)
VTWADRAQFFAFAAHVMRRVLVDHARERNRFKRGGGACTVALDPDAAPAVGSDPDVVAVDEALRSLERVDPRKASIVEMRFFAGLTLREAAAHLGISEETAGREWRRAKAWLRAALEASGG